MKLHEIMIIEDGGELSTADFDGELSAVELTDRFLKIYNRWLNKFKLNITDMVFDHPDAAVSYLKQHAKIKAGVAVKVHGDRRTKRKPFWLTGTLL